MKLLPAITAAALAVALATPAVAMVSVSDLNARVQSAVSGNGSGQVSVNVRGDTAYISGWVESSQQRLIAQRAALATDGIENVVNGVVD